MKYEFDEHIKSIGMVNELEIIIPLVKDKQVLVLNLKEKRSDKIQHQFKDNQQALVLLSFGQTSFFCLKENWPKR